MNVAAADDDITHVADERFNLIFEVLDRDNNGTLDKKEAYALVRQWDEQKDVNATLKKHLMKVVGVTSSVILLLAGSTFGATFVAVHASKETSIASSGAIMNKDGSRALSTVAHGNRIPVFNTTDSSPICIHSDEFEAIKEGVLDGAKVILDIESEADGSHGIQTIDGTEAYITDEKTCYNIDDPNKMFCIEKSDCVTEKHRALWEARSLGAYTPGYGMIVCGYGGPPGAPCAGMEKGVPICGKIQGRVASGDCYCGPVEKFDPANNHLC